jgi:hypothetical protein
MIEYLLSIPNWALYSLAAFSCVTFICALFVAIFYDIEISFLWLALALWPLSMLFASLIYIAVGIDALSDIINNEKRFIRAAKLDNEDTEKVTDLDLIIENKGLYTHYEIMKILKEQQIEFYTIVQLPVYYIESDKTKVHRNKPPESFKISFVDEGNRAAFLLYWGGRGDEYDTHWH